MISLLIILVVPMLILGTIGLALVLAGRESRGLGMGMLGTVAVVASGFVALIVLSIPRFDVAAEEIEVEIAVQETEDDTDPRKAIPNPPVPPEENENAEAIKKETTEEPVADATPAETTDEVENELTDDSSAHDTDQTDSQEIPYGTVLETTGHVQIGESSSQNPTGKHWIIEVGPYTTIEQRQLELDGEILRRTNRRVEDVLDAKAARIIKFKSDDIKYVKKRLLHGNVEHRVVHTSNAAKYDATAVLRFNHDFEKTVRDRWEQTRTKYRLMETGLGAGGILALLATFFGYLKLDTATRGDYTTRLQVGAAAVILALAAAGVLIALWVPWI